MDVGAFLDGVGTIDLLIVLYFIGFFVLGFAQGTIRRLIGIASILFSWFLRRAPRRAAVELPRRRTGRSSRRSTAT